jgi:branched-chain amino acid transport system substrate-binding protein
MSYKPYQLAIVLLLLVSLFTVSCGGQVPETEAPEEGGEEVEFTGDPILVGMIAPMSGTHAILGEWDEKAVLLAFEQVNAQGGIHGRELVLIHYDDEADPSKAVNLAERLCTEDEVVAAFACPNSTTTLAVVPVFAEYEVPHLTGALNAQITQQGSWFVFRNTAAGPVYEQSIVNYMVEQGYETYAIIADNSAYGQGQADYQQDALASHGIEPLVREIYAGDDRDFTGQLTRIIQADPEVLLFAGSELASGLIAKQARSMGYEGEFAGGAAVGTWKFIEVAEDAAEGVHFSSPYISNDVNEMTREFAESYEARWGEEPESHGAKGYDQAMLLIHALEACHPDITSQCIADTLHETCGFQGLQGEFCYDENGEGIEAIGIGVIEGGLLLPIEEE